MNETERCENETERCEICYFCRSVKGNDSLWFECRKRSPKQMDDKYRRMAIWPIVEAEHWCGKFKKIKKTKLQESEKVMQEHKVSINSAM
jgi:hypothetical protein